MTDSILCKGGASVSKDIRFEVVASNFTNGSDALVAAVGYRVESRFKLSSAILFGQLRNCLRWGLADS